MAYSIDKPLKFIHITKTAGTTIEKIGEEAGIDERLQPLFEIR